MPLDTLVSALETQGAAPLRPVLSQGTGKRKPRGVDTTHSARLFALGCRKTAEAIVHNPCINCVIFRKGHRKSLSGKAYRAVHQKVFQLLFQAQENPEQ
jgi:hypothetical protein